MYQRLYRILKNAKTGTNDETRGRHLIAPLVAELCGPNTSPAVLDVGAGYGSDLLAIKKAIPGASVSAVEGFPKAVEFLRSSGVAVASIDLERERLPFADNSFHVVNCNQVLEHVKELFWVVSELSRVCVVGGYLVIGVPNLGSLHNRVALLFGRQPPAIHVFGPHVRGFTVDGLRDFFESGQTLRVTQVLGGNFYPFQPSVARILARWFPGLAVSSFYVVEKVSHERFLNVLDGDRSGELVDTPYFRGGSGG
ncbi:class I SAM-dependent methyltransferase [Tautonia sp. JC769]|uniref:class I SAM-dependent methyltransferase n=1 Tax=Tautonia sp. JC769 TaxID=3232135 RepID=UPI0034599BF2